jgi:hypothetical protein
MPDEYERLRKQIEDGVHAAEKLQRLLAESKRDGHHRKPKFKLIKGGIIGGAIWAGVEWFRDYKRIAAALAATGITVTGAVIAEHPGSPGADPPRPAITKPAKPKPSVPPQPLTTRAVVPTPRRTSPPRTQSPAAPTTAAVKPTVQPTVAGTSTAKPSPSSTVSLPVTPTATPVVKTPVPTIVDPASCTGVDLLGLCLLGK